MLEATRPDGAALRDQRPDDAQPEPLSGLPTLLAALSRTPHPDDVAAAVVAGPGRPLGARYALIMWARAPHLVALGSCGLSPSDVDDLATIPLSADLQLTRSYWEGEAIVDPIDEVLGRYAGIDVPPDGWRRFRDSLGNGSLASAPIMAEGAVVGVFSISCKDKAAWSSVDIAVLDATGSALGLWLTHPVSGLPAPRPTLAVPRLTDRQRCVLTLIATANTNASIAAVLGVSASTVKQEIGRLLAVLQATDRTDAVRRASSLGLLSDAH